jgi:hypothetical protein
MYKIQIILMAMLAAVNQNTQLVFTDTKEDTETFSRRDLSELLMHSDPKLSFNTEIVLTQRSMGIFKGVNTPGFAQNILPKNVAIAASRFFFAQSQKQSSNIEDYEKEFGNLTEIFYKASRVVFWYLEQYKLNMKSSDRVSRISELAAEYKMPKIAIFDENSNGINILEIWFKKMIASTDEHLSVDIKSITDLNKKISPITDGAHANFLITTISTKEEGENKVNELYMQKYKGSEVAIFRLIDKEGILQLIPVFVTPKFEILNTQTQKPPTEKDSQDKTDNESKKFNEKYSGSFRLQDYDFVLMASSSLFDYLPLSLITLVMNFEISLKLAEINNPEEHVSAQSVKLQYKKVIDDYIGMITDKKKFLKEKEDLLLMPHLQVERPSQDFIDSFNMNVNLNKETIEVLSDCSIASVFYQRVTIDDNNQTSLLSTCMDYFIGYILKKNSQQTGLNISNIKDIINKIDFSESLLDMARTVSNMNYFVLRNNKEYLTKEVIQIEGESKEEQIEKESVGPKRSEPSCTDREKNERSFLEPPLHRIKKIKTNEYKKDIKFVPENEDFGKSLFDNLTFSYYKLNFTTIIQSKPNSINMNQYSSKKFNFNSPIKFKNDLSRAVNLGFRLKEFQEAVGIINKKSSSTALKPHTSYEEKIFLCSSNLKLLIWRMSKNDSWMTSTCFHESMSVVVRRVRPTVGDEIEKDIKKNEERVGERTSDFFEYLGRAFGIDRAGSTTIEKKIIL